MPKISVIVPVYRVEQYLCKCIDSILEQSFCDFELILVDDGSPDNCPQMCDEYARKDARVKVIHKKNGGLSSARNAALDIAQGEYITFVDSDDYIFEPMLQRVYETAITHDADIVSCNTYRSDVSESNLFYKEFSLQNKCESIKEYVVYKMHCGPCSKLYKRYIFETIRYPELSAYEDTYIWLDILNLTDKVAHIPDRLYFYNIREGSITTSRFSRKNLAILEASRHIQDFVLTHYPDLYDYVKYDYANALYFVLFNIAKSFGIKEFKVEYDLALRELKAEIKKFPGDKSARIQKYTWITRFPFLLRLRAYSIGIKYFLLG